MKKLNIQKSFIFNPPFKFGAQHNTKKHNTTDYSIAQHSPNYHYAGLMARNASRQNPPTLLGTSSLNWFTNSCQRLQHHLLQEFDLFSSKINFLLKISLIIFSCIPFCIDSVEAQPVLRKGQAHGSSLGHGVSTDWVLATKADPDCIHIYFAGWSEYEGGGTVPTLGKVNMLSGALVWEEEYNPLSQTGEQWGSFEDLHIEGDVLIAVGGSQTDPPTNFNSFVPTFIKVYKNTGVPLSGFPKNLIPSGHTDTRFLYMSPLFDSNGDLEGFIGAGRTNAGSGRTAYIAKLDVDGEYDDSFGSESPKTGIYYGPAGTQAKSVIKISDHSEIGYAFIGSIGSGVNTDLYISTIEHDGSALVWEETYTKSTIGGSYSDITPDPMPCTEYETDAVNNTEEGWYLIQEDDELISISIFDKFNTREISTGGCPDAFDIPNEILAGDIVFAKQDLDDGSVILAKNVEYFVGADFHPAIEKVGDEYLIVGGQYDANSEKINTVLLGLDEDGDQTFIRKFNTLDDQNCPFDMAIGCNDEIFIAGNNEVNGDEYIFYRLSNGCLENLSYDVNANLNISSNTTWNTNKTVAGTVTIEDGATLTIDDDAVIEFAPSWEINDYHVLAENDPGTRTGHIIIEDGGKLHIIQGTLKGIDACGQEWMWDGVELLNGGNVEMGSGANIEDAKFGILAGNAEYNVNGNYNPTETDGGGAIDAYGGTILNCRRGVHLSYTPDNYNPSNFTDVTFICDDYLKDISYRSIITDLSTGLPTLTQLGTQIFFSTHHASNFSIGNSTFSNTADLPRTLRSIGIQSFNAGYTVVNNTFSSLYRGILADNPTVMRKHVEVTQSNTFEDLNIGIQFRSGLGHKVWYENSFEAQSYSDVSHVLLNVPGMNIVNLGSARIQVEENDFAGLSTDLYTYGIHTDNGTSAPSGHKKNDFFRLKFGDQTQKDNSGLFISCNSFLEQKQAWFITGDFQDQGACVSGAAWTPNNQFKDGADQNNPENHIKSFTYFDYWLPSSNQTYRPVYNTSGVVTSLVCHEGTIYSGCDPGFPVNDTTVATRQSDYNGMDDGMERRMLGNELLRYYGKTDDTANFRSLIATMSDEPTKRSYALVLVNDGNLTGAQAVFNSLNSSDPENQDFSKLYSVVRYQKMNDYGLDELNGTQVLTLDSISLNRTQAAYMAQGILSYYYGYEFLIPIEFPDTTLEYRSKKEEIENKNRNPNTLYLAPNPVYERVDISLGQYNLINPEIDILDGQGKLIYNLKISNSNTFTSIDLKELNPSVYFVLLRDQGKIISQSKFIKY